MCVWPHRCSCRIGPAALKKKGGVSVKHQSSTEAAWVALYLEKLHSDAGEHELKERRDDQDVADGSDGHKHTLHHILRGRDDTHSLAPITRSRQVLIL